MSSDTVRPFILHVDDEPETLGAWIDEVNRIGVVQLEVRHPTSVSENDLIRASVVLVDVKLDRWPERDGLTSLALQPRNGLALLPVLQEHAAALAPDSPTAFALYSGAIHEISRGLVPRPHIVARAHNLEWVFDKSDDTATRVAQVAQLAAGVAALPRPWAGGFPDKSLRDWLGLPAAATWHSSGWRSIVRCRPPIHEFAEHTQGMGVLRWMLQKILPYPCFLIDDIHLAARLRLEPESLCAELSGDSPLSNLLSPALYGGELQRLQGRRWWRSGIDALVYGLVPDDPSDLDALHAALHKIAPRVVPLEEELAFPVLDRDYRVKTVLARQDEVVEIVPDDWPPFADAAWALRSDVDDAPEMRAIAQIQSEEAARS